MLMSMMLVVLMLVIVLERFVNVLVRVPLAQVQPRARAHENRRRA